MSRIIQQKIKQIEERLVVWGRDYDSKWTIFASKEIQLTQLETAMKSIGFSLCIKNLMLSEEIEWFKYLS